MKKHIVAGCLILSIATVTSVMTTTPAEAQSAGRRTARNIAATIQDNRVTRWVGRQLGSGRELEKVTAFIKREKQAYPDLYGSKLNKYVAYSEQQYLDRRRALEKLLAQTKNPDAKIELRKTLSRLDHNYAAYLEKRDAADKAFAASRVAEPNPNMKPLEKEFYEQMRVINNKQRPANGFEKADELKEKIEACEDMAKNLKAMGATSSDKLLVDVEQGLENLRIQYYETLRRMEAEKAKALDEGPGFGVQSRNAIRALDKVTTKLAEMVTKEDSSSGRLKEVFGEDVAQKFEEATRDFRTAYGPYASRFNADGTLSEAFKAILNGAG